ncbi:unnamed protein product [Mytilus edulis]|uniref:Uncharacterized protein n=1 Tax=Mytilus edulis TaxID=6550 RepID=A0A8S3SUM8_MYTED|nr:unnamed protein product [Mytilus edulis]
MAGSLPPYPTFDYASDKSNAGPRWERWVSRLENLFVGLKIENEERKRALLLHYAGESVYDIYDAEKGETEASYTATKQVLTTYFEPKKNTQMEVYKFRTHKQKEGQSLDEFVTELRKLAKTCEFTNVDKEILSQVIQNCKSNRLRRRALREPDKTLNDILTLGRTLEMADTQATEMERETTVNKITNTNKTYPKTNYKQQRGQQASSSYHNPNYSNRPTRQTQCRNCGGQFPHKNGPCPANGKTCNACHKQNHFAKVCRGKSKQNKYTRDRRVHEIQTETSQRESYQASLDSSDEEYSYSIKEAVCSIKKSPFTMIKVNNTTCSMMIDTGATVNILDDKTHKNIGSPKLNKNDIKLLPYGGGKPLEVTGACELGVETKHKYGVHKFYVVRGGHGALIGYPTASQLGLVKIIQPISIQAPEKSKTRSHEEKVAEQYVNFIANQAIPKAMSLSEVKGASLTDRTLQKAIELTRNGKCTKHSAKFSDQLDEEEELDIEIHPKEENKIKSPIQSRPTRIRKPPSYLQDYECKVRGIIIP